MAKNYFFVKGKKYWKRCGTALIIVVVFSFVVRALPVHRNLYREQYHYAPSCVACHRAKDSRLNPFGKEFLRLGHDLTALKTLESLDPDHDKVVTLQENLARSNPGDSYSTPFHPGPWLLKMSTIPLIPEEIYNVFGSTNHQVIILDSAMRSEQVESIERQLGVSLWDVDKYPLVFFVRDTSGTWIGSAAYAISGQKKLTGYLVVAETGSTHKSLERLSGVFPIIVSGDKRFSRRSYTKQFLGKNMNSMILVQGVRGSEDQNEEILLSIRRAFYVMNELGQIESTRPLKEN